MRLCLAVMNTPLKFCFNWLNYGIYYSLGECTCKIIFFTQFRKDSTSQCVKSSLTCSLWDVRSRSSWPQSACQLACELSWLWQTASSRKKVIPQCPAQLEFCHQETRWGSRKHSWIRLVRTAFWVKGSNSYKRRYKDCMILLSPFYKRRGDEKRKVEMYIKLQKYTSEITLGLSCLK